MAKKVLCPNCGVWHELPDEPKKGTFENRVRRPSFRTDAMAANLPQPGIVRETPVSLPTLPSHVYVPLYQSLIDGFFAFPVGVVGSIGAVAVIDGATSGFNPSNLSYALIGFGGGVAVAFFVSGRKWPIHLGFVNSLLWVAEEIFNTDFDGDEEIGEPEPVANQVQVEITEKGIPRQIEGLNVSPDKIQKLAQLVINQDKSFSERTAAEAGMSRDEEWIPLRDKFIKREWAAWRRLGSATQGVELLSRGRAVLEAFLPPALSGGDVAQNSGPSTHPRTPTQGNGTINERLEPIKGAK